MRATITGQVVSVKAFEFKKTDRLSGVVSMETAHEVVVLQAADPKDARSEPELVRVAAFNGIVKELTVGKQVSLPVTIRMVTRKDQTGRPYPPQLRVSAQ